MSAGDTLTYVASVKNLVQTYGKAVALDDVTLDIPANKMIGQTFDCIRTKLEAA